MDASPCGVVSEIPSLLPGSPIIQVYKSNSYKSYTTKFKAYMVACSVVL